MYNEFDHNKDFSKGFKILHKQDIGNWSNISISDDNNSDFFDFLFRRPVVTETPTPEEPDGSTLICGNSYFNNNRVISIYYNGVDLCATPPDEIAEPETPAPQPNVIGRQILRIDTRLNSPIGSNIPFSSGADRRSFELEFAPPRTTFDVNWGSSNVVGGSQNESNSYTNALTASIGYVNAGIYEITVSARSRFELEYPDIGGFGNGLLSITYPDNRFPISGIVNYDRNFLGCINLRTVDFPNRDEFGRPYGKDQFRSLVSLFEGCTSLTAIGFLTTNLVSRWDSTFAGCSSLQTIPNLDYNNAQVLQNTFINSGLVRFDSARPFGKSARRFGNCWKNCSSLRDFPAGQFDNVFQGLTQGSLGASSGQNFQGAFEGCALTAASIENILVSVEKIKVKFSSTNSTLVPAEDCLLSLDGGTNAAKSTWTSNAITAYNTLVSRGWTITFNP